MGTKCAAGSKWGEHVTSGDSNRKDDFGEIPDVKLVVDGQEVRLRPFVAISLDGVIRGYLNALDNLPKNPTEISLVIGK